MIAPLREPTFLILTALARVPLHGYGLITEVAELSGGAVELRPGTLYGALDRLTDDGLVTLDREEIVDGRARKYYRLTERGDAALRAETERLRRNVEAATRRLAERARPRRAEGMAGTNDGGGRRPWLPPAPAAIHFAGGAA
jgi:DNA-binding PadR family transcriptional regulator